MRVPGFSPNRPGASGTSVPPEDFHPADAAPGPDSDSVVGNAVYYRGRRIASPPTVLDTYELLRRGAGLGWIGLRRPSMEQFASIAALFDLDELAVEDAVLAHQRPKLERYDGMLFVVLRPARYDDLEEEVLFGEVHAFVGKDFVITVRHGDAPELDGVRERLEHDPDLLDLGPEAVLYGILDRVVDGYEPVVAGLEKDIDEIEVEVFRGDPKVSKRIYELSREVIEFQRATKPLPAVLASFAAGLRHADLQHEIRDVQDHAVHVVERLEEMRQILQNILATNAILVQQQQNREMTSLTEASFEQNEEVKKISAWAAILFAPTLIGTIYGMNFEFMPELRWTYGYALALALMAGVPFALFLVFRRRGWL